MYTDEVGSTKERNGERTRKKLNHRRYCYYQAPITTTTATFPVFTLATVAAATTITTTATIAPATIAPPPTTGLLSSSLTNQGI